MTRSRPVALRDAPTVSVVVPCYNYGHYLRAAVASALDQRDVAVDVTIVDDASTDDSVAVADELAAADPRVTVIARSENRGHIATFNEGAAAATGTYLLVLSADDMVAPDALTRAVGLMEQHPAVGLCYGWSPEFEDAPPPPRTRSRRHTVWSGQDWLMENARRARNLVHTPEAVMRTSVYRDIGGYDPTQPHTSDMMMWLKAANRADVGRVNGPDQGFYRVHGSNMHLTAYGSLLTDFEQRTNAFTAFHRDDAHLLRDAGAFDRTWRAAMAREAGRHAVDAMDADPPDPHLAAEFADRAAALSDSYAGSRLHRRFVALRDGRPGPLAGPSRQARRAVRSLEGKIRWRRWRRSGL